MKKNVKIKMSDEAREARNRYAREYRKKRPDVIRKNFADYWERKAMKAKLNGDDV